MTEERAIRLAREWAFGGVCTLQEGEAQEYHRMALLALEAMRDGAVPVVHGVPISKNRPQKHEIYEEAGTGENGETLYRKRIYVDEKNSVEYCPTCGKRLCSRFRSFCPSCGAKMDLEE